jgi:cytochrome c-type biogenesis protein CcmH
MTIFVLIAALMALLTLGLLTRPLWRRPANTETAAATRPPSTMIAGLTGFVAVVVLAGYTLIGAPLAIDPAVRSARDDAARQQVTAAQIDAMVEKLSARLKEQPSDLEGWLMLGRSYAVLNRHEQASAAFKQALALKPDDPALLADYADTLAASNGGNLEGEPMRLLNRALQIDPNNQKALALAGFAAFNRKDYALALRHWEKLAQIAPDGGFTRMIQGGIDETRRRMADAGQPPRAALAAVAPRAPAQQAQAVPSGSLTISGVVKLALPLATKAAREDTVFIYARAARRLARAAGDPGKQVKDLPLKFALDDSMAMSPAAKLSGAPEVIVSARISKRARRCRRRATAAGRSPWRLGPAV